MAESTVEPGTTVSDSRELIADSIRRRVLRAVQAGTLRTGDRLPSARELAGEFGVDYRLVIAAYKEIAGEGLVELRPRGGVYVAARAAGTRGIPPLPEGWFADVLTQALAREIPVTELHEWLRRSTETLRLRAVVVTTTADQVLGLCRELRDDFGFEAEGLTVDELRAAASPPIALRRADLVVTTAAHGDWLRTIAADLRKRLIVIEVRADLVIGEWALLLRRPVYAVVGSVEFGEMLRKFFATTPGVANLHVLVLGRDDLSAIPADAPTYVTQQVRRDLGGAVIRGRILPAARTISSESAREIFGFIVRQNVEAMSGREGH
ncbi:MAG: GntR family transcriptional regulator [Gemmatimonadaceae bacterium]|nr:GntR family transcriptional regulator [Gemmatimonadaceae bacterium]NUS97628.1 GntR family transcriptional regulator [Gemmatimonadaceae bacterium]